MARAAPTFVVDLDQPPHARWLHVTQHFSRFIPDLLKSIKKEEALLFGSSILSKIILQVSKMLMSWLSIIFIPRYIREEIEGISRISKDFGLDFGSLLMLNCGYDLVSHCTSIVCHPPEKSQLKAPLLLRNMDWDIEIFRKLVIQVDFQRNGKTVFKAVMFAFNVGLFTGLRLPSPKQEMGEGYCLALNYRKTTWFPMWNAFRLLSGFSWNASFLLRHTLDCASSYSQAVEMLSKYPLIAPCYFIISGAKQNEGCIITRERAREINRLELSSNQHQYIAQTNIDHWVHQVDAAWAGDDALLQNSTQRRSTAYSCISFRDKFMKEEDPCEQNEDKSHIVEWCFKILLQKPVFNEETIHTTVMSTGLLSNAHQQQQQQQQQNKATSHNMITLVITDGLDVDQDKVNALLHQF